MEYSNALVDPTEPTAYQILGVQKSDLLPTIYAVYRQFMLVLHPDRSSSEESKRLGLSDSDRYNLFLKVKNAYSEILAERKEVDSPDYNIEYSENSDTKVSADSLMGIDAVRLLRNRLHSELRNAVEVRELVAMDRIELLNTPAGIQAAKITNINFNQMFERENKPDTGPFSRGYGDKYMTEQRNAEHENIRETGTRHELGPLPGPSSWPAWSSDGPEPLVGQGSSTELVSHKRGLFQGQEPAQDQYDLTIVTDFSTDPKNGGTDLLAAEEIGITGFKEVPTVEKITNDELEKLMHAYRSLDINIPDTRIQKEIDEHIGVSGPWFDSVHYKSLDWTPSVGPMSNEAMEPFMTPVPGPLAGQDPLRGPVTGLASPAGP